MTTTQQITTPQVAPTASPAEMIFDLYPGRAGAIQFVVLGGATVTFAVQGRVHSDAGWVDVSNGLSLSAVTADRILALDERFFGIKSIRAQIVSVAGGTAAIYARLLP